MPDDLKVGGKTMRIWMHRKCLAGVVPERIAKQLEDLPKTTTEEIFASKVRPGS